MGGMRALEWVVGSPGRGSRARWCSPSGAVATADQIAHADHAEPRDHRRPRLARRRLPRRRPGRGSVARARRRAADRAPDLPQRARARPALRQRPAGRRGPAAAGGRYAVQSYLDHQADKLAHRFDAGLLRRPHRRDDARGTSAAAAAASTPRWPRSGCPLVVGGVDSDRLYPIHQQQRIADLAPGCVDGLRVIPSPYGHDGFLVEREQVFALVAETLDLVGRRRRLNGARDHRRRRGRLGRAASPLAQEAAQTGFWAAGFRTDLIGSARQAVAVPSAGFATANLRAAVRLHVTSMSTPMRICGTNDAARQTRSRRWRLRR